MVAPLAQLSAPEKRILYIVGPTASGKTALSLEIAEAWDAEIVCADSQTVRQGMDIGTAKPSLADRSRVAHHLIDIIGPYEKFSLHDFLVYAKRHIKQIHKKGKPVVVVGGTGLYIDGLYWDFEPIRGSETSYEHCSVEQLQYLVVENGFQLPSNSNNKRHLINTLRRGGEVGKMGVPSEGSIIIGINPAREILRQRIQTRVEEMMHDGFLEEVHQLIAEYGRPPIDFDAIGYRLALKYIDGEISKDECIEQFIRADMRYAKRQMTWFRRNKNTVWFDSAETAKEFILGL